MDHGISPFDAVIQALILKEREQREKGCLYGSYVAKVTNNQDPLGLGRIKVNFHWLEEVGRPDMESDWLHRVSPTGAGPTKVNRNRVFGMDWPAPEVGSDVIISFIEGDPHNGIYHGSVNYGEGDLAVPALKKDKDIDWSWRFAQQNGVEGGGDSNANVYLNIPGNLRIKVDGSIHISCRGIFTIFGTRVRAIALSVLRLLAPQLDQTNYPRPDEAAELREMNLDAMGSVPGYKDPEIGLITPLGDKSAP